MTPARRLAVVAAACCLAMAAWAVSAVGLAHAQPARPVPTASSGPAWGDLSGSQREALKPLQSEWAGIDAQRKQKWLEIAARMPTMPPAERARVSERMSQWAKMSPAERGQARLNFQETRQLPAAERQARWEAYQALPADQKRQFAERARSATPPPSPARAAAPVAAGDPAKSNIVPNVAPAAPRRPIAPTVVQAQPGATTPLMTRRPLPPAHQQPGLPKIAATPGFVDDSTLLPQRGPQGAAVRSTLVPPEDDKKTRR